MNKGIKSIVGVTLIIVVSIILFSFLNIPSKEKAFLERKSIIIRDRNEKILREIPSDEWTRARWVSLKDISPSLLKTIIFSEDKRFFSHPGIDFIAIGRAIINNLKKGRIIEGGSTITQQLIRISSKISERTIKRKIIEMLEASKLELKENKRKILEYYLNLAPFGNNIYGIESASRFYFGKPAIDLSLAEAALLSGIPRGPSILDPYKSFKKVKKIQENLLKKMFEQGIINEKELKISLNEKISLRKRDFLFLTPHFTEYLRKNDGDFKEIKEIVTTIDFALQKKIEGIVKGHLERLKNKGVSNASVLVVDNETGDVLSYIGSKDYFDKKSLGANDGVFSKRPPGSTIKPFLYALSLMKGFTLASIIPDIESHFETPQGEFSPENFNFSFRGPLRLRVSLSNSVNVAAVNLLSMIGVDNYLDFLYSAGFRSLKKSPEFYGVSLTLGDGEVSLYELVRAYSTLARGGILKDLRFIKEVRKINNEIKMDGIDNGKRAIGRDIAWLIGDVLSDEISRISAFGENTPLNFPFKVALKTGTSKNFRDNWAVGWTKQLTIGVWTGNFNAKPMKGVAGVNGAAVIFHDVMLISMEGRDKSFMEKGENINSLNICALSGELPSSDCPNVVEEYFIRGTEVKNKCSFHKRVKIDIRNGGLAGRGCPEKFVIEEVRISAPPQYTQWLSKRGELMIPKFFSPLCNEGEVNSEKKQNPDEIKILSPLNGSKFLLDPEIPGKYQTIPLKAIIPDGIASVEWWVDNKLFAKTDGWQNPHWQIRKGTHTISLKIPLINKKLSSIISVE